jgi:predicted NUDIX family NTP pyrophosphohydrolase
MAKVKTCSCGFILDNGSGWLLCHPTNAGNRWDFPKGMADEGESHIHAAIRELEEETGFILFDNPCIIDLGEHAYADVKNLHMYYIRLESLDSQSTKNMHCRSMVTNTKGPDFPEMDAFAIFEHHKIASKLSPRMLDWIKSHVPSHLLIGIV